MYDKNEDICFQQGLFTNICLDYIKYKRSMGQQFSSSSQRILRKICNHLNGLNLTTIILTKEVVEILASKKPEESQGTQIKRIRLLRQLAKFISFHGHKAYVYPKYKMPKYNYDFKPYLFSYEQILAIITAADKIVPNNCSPKAHLVYPAIIRTLYGCGLRSAEARKLQIKNVELDEGILYIEKSKFNVSRFVPMSNSLIIYIKKYSKLMNFTRNSSGYFFPSRDGGYYNGYSLLGRCHQLFRTAKIPYQSNGKLPRVHDLRHAHIGHALTKLIKEKGMDIYTAIPLIAAYVGHINLQDTERYLHLPEFEFSDIVKASQSVISKSLPELHFDE